MAQEMEPMDVDCMDSEFDNKENTYHNNMLPCTEKGYEELDVSELNMKLRYSITPAASPMSKSYTAYRDHETDDLSSIENNLTRSLNSTMTKHDSVIKSLKTLPLQSLPTDQLDRNSSVLRPLDTTITDPNNITVTISEANEIDENISLPSTSSSVTHTPEATTPVNDGGSPIMRGLKSVLNMFRPSQSPIPGEGDVVKQDSSPSNTTISEKPVAIASTPIAAHRKKDGNTSKRSSPLKDSIVFNDDLEKELQWKDETTIIFSQEKIPIHKLFYQNAKPSEDTSKNTEVGSTSENSNIQALVDNLNTTVEYMDISYNNSTIHDKTLSKSQDEDQIEVVIAAESDSEFVDCETTLNNESHIQEKEESVKDPLLGADAPKDRILTNPEIMDNILKEEVTKVSTEIDTIQNITFNTDNTHKEDVTKSETTIKEDTDSTISIIQELDSLLEFNDSKKEISTNESNLNTAAEEIPPETTTDIVKIERQDNLDTTTTIEKPTEVTDIVEVEKRDENEILAQPSDAKNTNLTEHNTKFEQLSSETKLECVQITIEPQNDATATLTPEAEIDKDNQPELILPCEKSQTASVNDQDLNVNEVAINLIETPADVPLPDEDDLDIEFMGNATVNGTNIIQTTPDVIENAPTEVKCTVAEHLENSFSMIPQENVNQMLAANDSHENQQVSSGIQEEVNTTQVINKIDEITESVNEKTGEILCSSNTDEVKFTVTEHLENSFSMFPQENVNKMSAVNDNQIQQAPASIQEVIINTTQVISIADEITESENEKFGEIVCSTNTDFMDIHKTIHEGHILPDLVNQTIPTDNALNILENKDQLNTECTKDSSDVKSIESPVIQEPQNMSISELPVIEPVDNVSISDTNDLHLEINSITQVEDTTSNEADSTVTLDDQTVNTQNNITVELIDDKTTSQENVVNSTVIIDNGTNEKINTTVSLENSKDLTQNISPADVTLDAVLENANVTTDIEINVRSNDGLTNTTGTMECETSTENATIPDEHTPIQENEVNSTVIIENNTDAADATVTIDEINNVAQPDIQVNKEIQPNIDSNTQNLDDIQEPPSDIEIVLSENNSPYVSVMAGIDTEPKLEDNFEALEFSRSDVPSSPPIVSKGYNFNFDDIEDPFATKTKIRQSPTPDTPSKNVKEEFHKETEMPKRAPNNRRKSQPPERKRAPNHKKKLNTTINVTSKDSHDKAKTEKQTIVSEVKIESAESTIAHETFVPNEELKEKNRNEEQAPENTDSINSEERDAAIKVDAKSSCELSSGTEVKTTSSSEQSYFSAAGSSTDSFISKNVFNIPEIDDSNFNPFATKSKMRESPPLVMEENPFATKSKLQPSPDSSMFVSENAQNDVKDKMDVEMMEKEAADTSVVSSSKSDDKNATRNVNTEDEDTEEGPFLEAEEVLNKTSVLDSENIEFNSLPTQNDNNLETGEVFIDAEAFEFFLNQNQSSMVADSGKESLFLKFDPLFAKRISSDGVVAALKNVQKRQSTPTKTRQTLRNEASPIAGPSNLNTTFDADMNASQESNDEANITVAKPTMIVTPAVNPVVTPRNKSITPNRSNRRSITFTSPAMAVIDRLISMSANNSLVDTTVTQPSRDQHEADAALSQLRELLAEKEINVYNLRAESMLLRERLATMESQVKTLEDEGQDRLKKINELNSRLIEKSEINKRMAEVVEEYERTIASLIAETEQDKKRHAEERIQLIKERDEQTAHLASMEASFSDLHSKYEKSKQIILSCKANEETYKKSINDFEESLKKMQNNYEMLKQHATSKLNHANQELEKMNKAHEAEVLKLNALLKRKELHITSLEESLALKTKANDELTAICDELINKVG